MVAEDTEPFLIQATQATQFVDSLRDDGQLEQPTDKQLYREARKVDMDAAE